MRTWSAAVLVFALAATVHARSLGFSFLDYDDPHFILAPEVVRAPSMRSVGDVLTKPVWGSYHPLHILSYSADAAVWGLERPQGFHATNVLLFALSAALLVFVARSFGCSLRGAALAGVLFAVHPSHVESVAWLTGRKDVLSGLFVLLALLVRDRTRLSLFFFLLALASKTTAAALAPFLVLDYWLTRSSTNKADSSPREAGGGWEGGWRRLVPFVLLALVWLVIEAFAQRSVGGIKPLHEGSFLGQTEVVAKSLAWYPVRFFLPYPLTPHPTLSGYLGVSLSVLAIALVLAFVNARYARAVAFFFLALAPVSNVLPLSNAVQDRYLYLPSLAAACVVGELLSRRKKFILAAALLAAFFALETWRYELVWQSDELLWQRAVEVEPDAPLPRLGLAAALEKAGKLDFAEVQARKAVDLGGGSLALIAFAHIEEVRGHSLEARDWLLDAWRSPSGDPSIAPALVRLLVREGDGEAARVAFGWLETRSPDALATHRARAYLAQFDKDYPRAEAEYLAAESELDQDDWLTLAALERALGQDDRARLALGRALSMDSRLRQRLATDPVLGPLLPQVR